MKNLLKYCIITSMILSVASASASVVEDAEVSINFARSQEDYQEVLTMLQDELKRKQKPNTAIDLKYWAGVACFHLEKYDEAEAYFEAATSRHADAYRYLGKIRYADYDFEAALEAYDDYQAALKKAKKSVPEDVDIEAEVNKATVAQSMLDRVESIVVIDSINVPYEKFFSHYRLALSAGRLRPLDELPIETPYRGREQMFYANENDDFILWANIDSALNRHLYEASRLNDGTWQEPVQVDFGDDRRNYDAYPFMMSDGSTLYFASEGEGSIGGYDIFCSNRDPETHEYMSPLNVGMPYNSPYNDFMLAIDEENGVGWWATDRHTPSDGIDEWNVTIYVFIPNTIRVNRNIDDPNIVNYAKVDNYKSTWEEGADYSELLNTISQIDPNTPKKEIEFNFRISKDVLYQNFDDFKTDEGRELMQQYLEALQEFEDFEEELSELRKEYNRKPSPSLASEIRSKESLYKTKYEGVNKLRNRIYKIEK